MRLRDPRLWLALISATAVLSVVLANVEREMPGPLSHVHAREDRLAGARGCAECHGGWFSDMQSACLECHATVAAQIEAGRGLHGMVGQVRTIGCGGCHSEHHGAGFLVTNRQSFRLAGVDDPAAFDHRIVGFAMDGRHLELACTECHPHAEEQPLAAGHRRHAGLDRDCATCHEDPHEGAMQVRCDQCHGQRAFDEPASAGHERFLPLTGGHAGVDCRICHRPGSAHDVMVLGRTQERSPRTCQDCHESPHRAGFVAGAAERLGAAAGGTCGGCHLPRHTSFRDSLDMPRELHALAGFPLERPHDRVACTECHPPRGTFAERHPGRSADACASCHEDVHGGQFAPARGRPTDCTACHARTHFAPHGFTLARHARTAFPLTGRHADAGCDACHARPDPRAPRRFRGTEGRCDDCHEDVHQGRFAAGRDRTTDPAGTCVACHDTASFRNVRGFDHARTGFELAGAHAQAPCTSCHPRTNDDRRGRTLGRVVPGDHRGCTACHRDPHGGRFDRPGLPSTLGGAQGCARCHSALSFRNLPHGFDHGLWTGFPLQGAHAEAACAACHEPLLAPDRDGRTWKAARGTDCADCHREPHAGQFAAAGRTDCRRCHRPAATFADLRFRHDLDSRFALGEAHRDLPCSSCHVHAEIDGQWAVRYRPIPRECRDCHGAQLDLTRRKPGARR